MRIISIHMPGDNKVGRTRLKFWENFMYFFGIISCQGTVNQTSICSIIRYLGYLDAIHWPFSWASDAGSRPTRSRNTCHSRSLVFEFGRIRLSLQWLSNLLYLTAPRAYLLIE